MLSSIKKVPGLVVAGRMVTFVAAELCFAGDDGGDWCRTAEPSIGSEAWTLDSSCSYREGLLGFATGVAELSSWTFAGAIGKTSSTPSSSASEIDSVANMVEGLTPGAGSNAVRYSSIIGVVLALLVLERFAERMSSVASTELPRDLVLGLRGDVTSMSRSE